VNIAVLEVIQEENADLKAQVAQLRRDLENFPRLLAEMISRAKAEEPAQ
jgi:cell division septum initiation protein DivIVA